MKERDRTAFGARLRRLRIAAGLSQMAVQRAIGLPQSTLGEMETVGKGASKWLIPLAQLYGVSAHELAGDQDDGEEKAIPGIGGEAAQSHAMRLITGNVARSIDWESLRVTNKLPEVFKVFLPDDAMAGRFPKDSYIEFDSSLEARAGDVVLLRDQAGEHYIRYLRERRKGELVAVAENPAYLPMDFAQDGLEIRAVLVGAGWSGRLT